MPVPINPDDIQPKPAAPLVVTPAVPAPKEQPDPYADIATKDPVQPVAKTADPYADIATMDAPAKSAADPYADIATKEPTAKPLEENWLKLLPSSLGHESVNELRGIAAGALPFGIAEKLVGAPEPGISSTAGQIAGTLASFAIPGGIATKVTKLPALVNTLGKIAAIPKYGKFLATAAEQLFTTGTAFGLQSQIQMPLLSSIKDRAKSAWDAEKQAAMFAGIGVAGAIGGKIGKALAWPAMFGMGYEMAGDKASPAEKFINGAVMVLLHGISSGKSRNDAEKEVVQAVKEQYKVDDATATEMLKPVTESPEIQAASEKMGQTVSLPSMTSEEAAQKLPDTGLPPLQQVGAAGGVSDKGAPTIEAGKTPEPPVDATKTPELMTPDEFTRSEDMDAAERAQYVDEKGNVIASSRDQPSNAKIPPVGTWRKKKSGAWNKYGDIIEQLREVKVSDIHGVEDTGANKKADVERYTDWIKSGKEIPPFRVAKLLDGTYQLSDGHRRLLALRKAGVENVKTWVADSADTGLREPSGKVIDTDMTHQTAINDALKSQEPVSATAVDTYGIKLPDSYVKEGDRYIFKPPLVPPPTPPNQTPVQGDKTPITTQESGEGALASEPALAPEPPSVSVLADSKKYPPVDVPISELSLAEDVPNFKENADKKTGVVKGQQLGGEFNRFGAGQIAVWERLDGRKQIISGRHRFDLAKRSGEKTISAQIVREADGFTRDMALTHDAEANIKDGQGEVSDYAHYFRNKTISASEARARSLLGRAKGDAGWALGKDASDDLYALYRKPTDGISEGKAVAIAQAAPGNADLQGVGIRAALEGNTEAQIVGQMEAAQSQVANTPAAEQGDMFKNTSYDETWKAQGKYVAGKRKALTDIIATRKAIVNRYDVATSTGSIKATLKKATAEMESAQAELERWKSWSQHPDLRADVEALGKQKPVEPVKKQSMEDVLTKDAFNLTRGKAPEAKLPEAPSSADTIQTEMFEIQKVVQLVDPKKSADFAEQNYGGAKEALARVRNQLRVVDSDPKTKKDFPKESRQRLQEVIKLLEQRALKDGEGKPLTRSDFNARFDTLKKLTDATGKKFSEKDIYSAIGDKHWDTMTPEERTASLATLDKLIADRSPETILGFGGTKTVKQPATMKEAVNTSVKLTPKDKISRPIRKAVQPFVEAWDGLVKLVAPTLRTEEAEKAGSLLMEQYGKSEVEKEQTLGALRRAVLDGAKEADEKLPLRVRLLDKMQSSMHTLADSWFTVKGKDAAYKFMSNMSSGVPQPTAIARNIQSVMEHGYQQLAETIQNFGEGKLSELREHYFGTYWTPDSRRAFNQAMGEAGEKGMFLEGSNPNEASAEQKAWVKNRVQELMKEGGGNDTDAMPGLSRRPLEGAKSFLKEKVFDDFMTAVDFGLEPASWNPVDMFTMKIHEMQKYILAHNFYDAIAKEGWDKFLYTGKDVPEGWVQAPGPHGTVYGPPEIKQTEYVDKNVYDALMDVAKGIGVTHERVVNAGRGKLGYASTSGKMVSQAGTELSVVAHELGHELDFKYKLWDKIVKNAVGVGKRGEATKTASAEKRGTIQTELRALADLTFEGQEPSDYYKSKVRKEAEKMAHMLEAYIHAPEKFRQVAPTVFSDFDGFIRQTPELAKLADIKQGLALKRMDIARKVGGYPVVGSRIVPEAIGQVLKNHLSPTLYSNEYFGKFWGAYMGAANQLNRFQLGFGSQFHAGFTSMETIISEVSLGAKALSKGDMKNAVKFFGKAPLEVILNPMRGNRVLKAMQGNSPVTPEMAKVIEGAQAGWIRRSMDRRMWPESTQSMINDWVTGKPIKAIARAPMALVEQTIRPVMEWLVPRQKFGVFSETLNYWLESHPNATHDEFVKESQHIVSILDERLGQVNYERIFANNVAKNIVQGVVRAPGWTGGTILQVGRGLTDLAGNFKDLATGKPTELSDRSAYTLSLVVVTAIANGLLTKLFTGENPDAKDLLAFRTGLKDEKGDYERFMLPTYMKDMYAFAKDIHDLKPTRTLMAKTHPAVSMLNEVNENKDYYGVEIRHKGDSLVDQFGQLAGHIVKGFVPFWMRGVQKETERGAGLLEKTLPLIGVMPARRAMTASPAEQIIDESRNRMEHRTKVQFDKSKLTSQLRNKVARENEEGAYSYPELDKALEEEKITGKEYKEIVKDAMLPPIVRELKHIEVLDAVRVWDAANDTEKEQIQDTVLSKIYKATNLTDDKKAELADKVAAFEPKQVTP